MSNGLSQEAALAGQMAEKGTLFGSMSEKGAPGKDGKTPVKGVDYWTEADKNEIIKEAMPHPDYTENDPTSKNYIQNRPGGYVQETFVDIEWDGNTEGKYVVAIFADFYHMCKVSDTPLTLEKLKGSIFTVWGLIDGNEVYDSVTDFSEDDIQKYDGGFAISLNTPQKELVCTILVVNSAPLIMESEEPGRVAFNEIGVYFSDIKGFDSSGSKIQLRSVKKELIKKMPSKYLDLDSINSSIKKMSETLDPLPKKIDSLTTTVNNHGTSIFNVEQSTKGISEIVNKMQECVSGNYYTPQKGIIYCVTSIKDTTEVVDITLPEESKSVPIYFEPKAEFNTINKSGISFNSDSRLFPAKQYNIETSKWIDLHRASSAGPCQSHAYVDDNEQLVFLYVHPDDVGKTVAMTKEHAWKTIKLPNKSGCYSKEYVVIECTGRTYIDRINVSGDWTSKSEPFISGKGVKLFTFATLERIEQLTDDYINNLIDTKLGVIENGSY